MRHAEPAVRAAAPRPSTARAEARPPGQVEIGEASARRRIKLGRKLAQDRVERSAIGEDANLRSGPGLGGKVRVDCDTKARQPVFKERHDGGPRSGDSAVIQQARADPAIEGRAQHRLGQAHVNGGDARIGLGKRGLELREKQRGFVHALLRDMALGQKGLLPRIGAARQFDLRGERGPGRGQACAIGLQQAGVEPGDHLAPRHPEALANENLRDRAPLLEAERGLLQRLRTGR
jgi:hypothetical protein